MNEKFSRNQRVAIITKILIENPNKVINLNVFTNLLNAAKSTISEDIVIVRESLKRLEMGTIETVSGAAGGVKFICDMSSDNLDEFISNLTEELQKDSRVILGNFLYLSDILSSPRFLKKAGTILASKFIGNEIDYVVTVETKGIPLAYEVANKLGVDLIIVRRGNKITEGTTVSINYLSGSSNRIQTMSLSKKSLPVGSRCVFIDDFMKAGGTAVGIKHLLEEFQSELVGTGVLIDDRSVEKKLVEDYIAIVEYDGFRNNQKADIKVSRKMDK